MDTAQMRELLRKEDDNLWAQGDLMAQAAMSDVDLARLAHDVSCRVSVLRMRERVAREFPADQYDRTAHTWGAYQVVLRLPREERVKLLNSRAHWTEAAIRMHFPYRTHRLRDC